MSKTLTYTQCTLSKGTSSLVTWVPTTFAVKNKMLEIMLSNKWSNGWKVKDIGIVLDAKHAEEHEMDYKKTRKATDI